MDSLKPIHFWSFPKYICSIILTYASFVANGNSKVLNLLDLEYHSASAIVRELEMFEMEKANVPITNLYQVFKETRGLEGWDSSHPSWFQRKFKKFGKSAGFKHSYFEKYVIAPALLTNLNIRGTPVLMSAQPVRFGWGDKRRVIISRIGPGDYNHTWLSDYKIRKVFKETSATIPQPQTMPLPPKAPAPEPQDLITFMRIRSWRLANALGIPQEFSLFALLASLGVIIILVGMGLYGLCLMLARFRQERM